MNKSPVKDKLSVSLKNKKYTELIKECTVQMKKLTPLQISYISTDKELKQINSDREVNIKRRLRSSSASNSSKRSRTSEKKFNKKTDNLVPECSSNVILSKTCSQNNSLTDQNDMYSSTKSDDFVLDEDEFLNAKYDKKWTLDDFSVGKPVGKGRFGQCFLAKEKRTSFNWLVVLKILSKKMLIEHNTEKNFKQEYENQGNLNHPNILQLFGYFDDEKKIYLILEYAPNGNLYNKIINNLIDNEKAAKYIYQTTKALIYLHERNIIHRDLKPENLLIGHFDEIKLADFGWSKIDCASDKDKSIAGTLDYLCPEMLAEKPHNTKVDNWCLGVLCYELLVGSAPFHHNDQQKSCDLIRSVKYSEEKIPNNLARVLIGKLLQKIPENRLELKDVIIHEWIEKYADKNDEYERYFVSS